MSGETLLDTTTAGPDRTHRPFAWGALGTAVVAALAMAAISWWAYPHMAAEIITRPAGGRHGQSTATRQVTAAAMPTVTLLLGAVLCLAPRLRPRFFETLPAGQAVNPANAVRVLNIVTGFVVLVLLAIHVGVISMFMDNPLPMTPIVTSAAGAALAGLGIAMPLTRPEGHLTNPDLERVRATGAPAYRTAGYVLLAAGLLVIALAWIAPWAAMAVGILAVFVAFALPLVAGARALR